MVRALRPFRVFSVLQGRFDGNERLQSLLVFCRAGVLPLSEKNDFPANPPCKTD